MPVSRFFSTDFRIATLAALFTPTVLFVNAGNNVLLRNLADVPYDPGTVGGFIAGFLLSAVGLVPAFRRAQTRRGWGRVARTVLALGLCVLSFNVVAQVTARPGMHVLAIAGADLAVVVAVAVALSVPRLTVILRFFAVIAVVLLAQGILGHGLTVAQQRRPPLLQREQDSGREGAVPSAGAPLPGNVYHFVFDEFAYQGYADAVAADPALEPEDFMVYPSFKSQYGLTYMSLANAVSGTLYVPGTSVSSWMQRALTEGVWAQMARAGFGVALYPYYADHCPPGDASCFPLNIVSAGRSGRRTVVDLWFLSILPQSAKRLLRFVPGSAGAESQAFSITSFVAAVLRPQAAPAGEADPAGAWIPDFPGRSLAGFQQVRAAERSRPPRGQYVFVHLILPHSPYLLDAGCVNQGHGWTTETAAYRAQVGCALRLLAEFTAELQALGRYDDALIIAHGDHGLWRDTAAHPVSMDDLTAEFLGFVAAGGDSPYLVELDSIAHRSAALLLVKWPGQTRAEVSAAPAQMLDIAPTILAHAGLPSDRLPGVPLRALDEGTERDVVFFTNPMAQTFRMAGPLRRFELQGGAWVPQGELPLRD